MKKELEKLIEEKAKKLYRDSAIDAYIEGAAFAISSKAEPIIAYVLQNSLTKEFLGMGSSENKRRPVLTKDRPKIYNSPTYARRAKEQIKGFNNIEVKKINLEVL